MINTSPHILASAQSDAPATPTPWATDFYVATDKFTSIPCHACVCSPDRSLLIAACGPIDDPASKQDAEFICRAVNEYEGTKAHVANLEQENTELHELIGVQRAEIEALQSQNRRLRARLASVSGYLRLMLALFFDKPAQPSSN